tara:strand:+ start:137 stop:352 length:216 start_codon:yes stop_codon:yes gene_type:complete
MSIKILTHVIRRRDGHVMCDWIEVASEGEAFHEKRKVVNGYYDDIDYAVRMRRYPKEKHLKDTVTKTGMVW